MKKRIGLFLVLGALILAGQAGAELSTNLRIETVINRSAKNKPATETYVDAEGNPVIPSDKGYATLRYTYEGKRSRIIKIERLDTEGNLINGTDGYAVMERKYNHRGRTVIAQWYTDAEGNPATGPEGYARYEVKSAHGRYKEEWQYDPDGNPVNTHQITLYYDGNRIKTDSWYDANDKPAAGPNGYARMEIEYTGNKQSKVAYYDEKGNLFYYKKAGYARMEREYAGGNLAAIRYYGPDNELTAGPDGYACVKYSYYPEKRIRTMFYNADGTLYYNKKGICGIEKQTAKTVKKEYYFTGEDKQHFFIVNYSDLDEDKLKGALKAAADIKWS